MNKFVKSALVCILFVTLGFSFTAEAAYVHRVGAGESLYLIAQKYDVSIQEILSNNRYLRNHNTIFPKQVLIIPKSQEPGTYVVRAGDSLHKISQQFGVSTTQIASKNGLANPDNLHVGQVLLIPEKDFKTTKPIEPTTYTVKPGDSLYRISKSLGISMGSLAEINDLENINFIYVGQVLKVPEKDKNIAPQPQTEANFEHSVTQLSKMYPDTFYLKGEGRGNKIALTFDDGPNPTYTPQVLDVLKRYDVAATFFVLGSRVERHPEIAKRIVNDGHVIANHTWSHPNMRNISTETIVNEMKQTENAIKNATGKSTALMRPPYGAVTSNVIEDLSTLDYKAINWSVDSVDWRDQDVDKILINTLSGITGNDIVLFHDAGGDNQSRQATVLAIAEIIETLRMQGYEFTTTDEILNVNPYK
ncbi:LysM peptidoglycan-binding domain-containing protein [Serpentinicella sp. ANB-PHB4]|uniref:LysM peptidoglycan-binding domain-containing protein n=1 Tax=Serpentinicella sp. ANB-PHB4 TaxID=3074076 RepID=UPI00285E277D|nr:LysM peptidoglycan-binding domain-containing protein [Serpentinicella sp. ANB-PHB4]MDR5659438.1 LysM peptidoglycan-binding domain-containing protein [Serpentinicella sp. ANB-PHB4]